MEPWRKEQTGALNVTENPSFKPRKEDVIKFIENISMLQNVIGDVHITVFQELLRTL